MAFKVKFPWSFYFSSYSWLYAIGYLAVQGGPCSICFFNSPHQRTPLHRAAEGGHVDIVRCLVDKGADINISIDGRVSE